MADKPVVLVTRKLPPNVEARLERDYRPLLNAEDRLYDTEELLRGIEITMKVDPPGRKGGKRSGSGTSSGGATSEHTQGFYIVGPGG